MPTDIALHPMGNPLQGNHPPAPPVPQLSDQLGVAEGADSGDINVPATGGVLVLQASVKVRVGFLKSNEDGTFTGSPNAAGSAVILNADQPRLFSMAKGKYRIRTVAYA